MKIDIYTLALITDIYGTFWLAKAIIWRSKRRIDLESATFWAGNLYLKAAQIEAKFYGWYGFLFLTLGFLGQILSQNFNNPVSKEWFVVYILVLLITGYFFNRLVKFLSNKDIPQEVKNKYGGY